MTTRRDVLRGIASATAWGPLLLAAGRAQGRGRTPYGGTLRLNLPLGLRRVDPHDLFDLEASVLGSALFDSLFALDESGRPYPTLAAGLPEVVPGGLQVSLRPNLKSATGRSVEPSDVEFSLKRASRGGARLLLQPFGTPRRARGRRDALLFPTGEPLPLARALASPLVAVVPRGFRPERPDGTGPFAITHQGAGMLLERNARAARGGAFLDAIDVRHSPDLAAALRAFEADEADVGWLASGLHRARQRAEQLDAGKLGWIVLATGRQLGPWAAPGVAQTVLDEAHLDSLSALGLAVQRPKTSTLRLWRGPTTEVLVDAGTPQLLAIARALAEAMGGSGSGLTVNPVPASTLQVKKTTGDYGLLLEFVRVIGRGPGDDARALLTAASLTSAGGSARLDDRSLHASGEPLNGVTRRLQLGVVGALRLRGAHLGRFAGLDRWQLGDVYRRP